jgi:predicted esterase
MSSPDAPDGELGHIHVFEPPAGPGRAAAPPTLLMLHGTGGNEHDLLPLGRTLAPEAALLSPRGKILEHGRPRFFRRLAEGVFDLPDLELRTNELADFVLKAADRYRVDLNRLIAVGFSNGANIAASLLLLRPEVLGAAVLFRAMVPLVPERLPNLAHKPVLISNGQLDPLVAVAQTERLAALLKESGADVTLEWQAAGHELTPRDVARASDWIAHTRSG